MDDHLHRMSRVEVGRADVRRLPALVDVYVLPILGIGAGEEIEPYIIVGTGPVDNPDTVSDSETTSSFFDRNRHRMSAEW